MIYRVLADVVVVIHGLFIAFVVLGVFLALRWRWLVWLHVPAAIWGVLIEYAGWICPLTPLENYLRSRAGEASYSGDFIQHYLLGAIYPHELARTTQLILGSIALVVNVIGYTVLIRRRS
jgi:glucose uptake protein GlcU